MRGRVYDAVSGQPIAGASVSVVTCLPRTFSAETGLNGRYTLLLPAQYLNACREVTLRVTAPGCGLSQVCTVTSLRANPERDAALDCAVTATATPPGDLTLTGRVSDASGGLPVSGATIAVVTCLPRTFTTRSWSDGGFSLTLPAEYLNACTEVTLQVTATGYDTWLQTIAVAALRASPTRDVALMRLPAPAMVNQVYLPVIRR
jgi:hypothetical protein